MQAKTLSKLFFSILVLIIMYFVFQYLLPLFFPFLFSAGLALLLHPLFCKISKASGISSTIIGIFTLVLILATGGFALFFLLKLLFFEVKSLTENLSYYQEIINSYLSSFCLSLEKFTGMKAYSMEEMISSQMVQFIEETKTSVSSKIFRQSFSYVKLLIQMITVCFLTLVSFILWLKDYDRIKKFTVSIGIYNFFQKIYSDTKSFFGTYLKAQLIILLITCILSVIGLFTLKNPYALLLGIFIGLMDMLPFLGTGCFYIPCCIFSIFQANFFHSAIYITLYLVTALSREFLEPKLLGKKFGIPSILILMVIYLGIELFGLAGIILGPLYFLLCYEIISFFTYPKNTT